MTPDRPPDAAATGSQGARQPNRRGEGVRLRSEILAAAAKILDATGDENAVTLRAVARAAGISAPSIYAHFPNRQAILLAVVEDAFSDLTDHLRTAADPDTGRHRPAAGHLRRLPGLCDPTAPSLPDHVRRRVERRCRHLHLGHQRGRGRRPRAERPPGSADSAPGVHRRRHLDQHERRGRRRGSLARPARTRPPTSSQHRLPVAIRHRRTGHRPPSPTAPTRRRLTSSDLDAGFRQDHSMTHAPGLSRWWASAQRAARGKRRWRQGLAHRGGAGGTGPAGSCPTSVVTPLATSTQGRSLNSSSRLWSLALYWTVTSIRRPVSARTSRVCPRGPSQSACTIWSITRPRCHSRAGWPSRWGTPTTRRAGRNWTTRRCWLALQRVTPSPGPPGQRFSYDNTGYVLLAELVRVVHGREVADVAQSDLFKPLGLAGSRLGGPPPLTLPGHAAPPRTIGDGGLWTCRGRPAELAGGDEPGPTWNRPDRAGAVGGEAGRTAPSWTTRGASVLDQDGRGPSTCTAVSGPAGAP